MEKKLPVRMCVACREQKLKKDLIRIVKNSNNEISIDFTGKKAGRGAYICDSIDCINKCVKNKMLNKHFDMTIPDSVYQDILAQYEYKD